MNTNTKERNEKVLEETIKVAMYYESIGDHKSAELEYHHADRLAKYIIQGK